MQPVVIKLQPKNKYEAQYSEAFVPPQFSATFTQANLESEYDELDNALRQAFFKESTLML